MHQFYLAVVHGLVTARSVHLWYFSLSQTSEGWAGLGRCHRVFAHAGLPAVQAAFVIVLPRGLQASTIARWYLHLVALALGSVGQCMQLK